MEKGEDHGHAQDAADREFEIFAEINITLRDLRNGKETNNYKSHYLAIIG